MSEILDGKMLAKSIKEKAKLMVADFEHPPGLAVILIGNDSASQLYVKLKEESAKEIGIYVEKYLFPETSTDEVVELIKRLNNRKEINGILVQFPLPENLDSDTIVKAIDPMKDVDGFHPQNREALLNNQAVLVPPVALSIMRLIQASRQPLKGKNAVVIGNSEIFAEPILELLKEASVSPTFVEKNNAALPAISRAADILVVAVGEAGFLKPAMVKEAAIIIDVGTNKAPDGKVVGDVGSEVKEKAGFISKVPGGVGPLTVAYMLMNVIKAASR